MNVTVMITFLLFALQGCYGNELNDGLAQSLRGRQRNLQVGTVIKLGLVNANTDKRIIDLFDGMIIDVNTIPGMSFPAFNINATVSGAVQSVVFGYNSNPTYKTENSGLMAFCGNKGTDFSICDDLGYGTHRVTATPYSLSDGKGTAGASVSMTFTITNRTTTKAPTRAPVAPPTKAPIRPPTKAPTKRPTKAPTKAPTKPPVAPPVKSPTKAPTAPPVVSPITPVTAPTSTEGITALELIYTGTLPHVSVMNLAFNSVNVVDLSALGLSSAQFNINAVRAGSIVNSVRFSNGQNETSLPYAFCGNNGPEYYTCQSLALGSTTTVTVTPFPLPQQQGTPFPVISTTIQIIQGNVRPSAPVVAPSPPVAAPMAAGPVSVPVAAPVAAPNASCPIPRFVGEWQGYWAGSKKYPITVAEAQGALIGNDWVIFAGFKNGYTNVTTETYALDMSNATANWRRMDDMPVREGLTHIGLVVIGMKAYMCGGYLGGSIGPQTHHCLSYDHSKAPGTGQWSTFASLPDGGRSGGGMVYDKTVNALFYAAGCTRPTPGNIFAIDHTDTWMYSFNNPGAGWVPKTPIPYHGNHISFVTAKDKTGRDRHFLTGGQQAQDEHSGNVNDNFEYDAVNDKWIRHPSQPITRGHAAASTRAVSCGFIVAGGISNEQGMTADVSYYDIPSATWTSIGILPNPINTPVCVIRGGWMHCETGWDSGIFSWMRQIVV